MINREALLEQIEALEKALAEQKTAMITSRLLMRIGSN